MDAANAPRQSSKLLAFERTSPKAGNYPQPRLGRLTFRGRTPIETPNYVAVSSRGTVPHLSQDMMRDHTSIGAMYAALEDFIEKATLQSQAPPVFSQPASPHESRLRKFIALPEDALLILGPRRVPPLPCSAASTSSAISIVTSLGFGMLESADYVEAIRKLRPDIVLGMGDVLFGHKPGVKRMDTMGDRTLDWVKALIYGMNDGDEASSFVLFAPILPIEAVRQSYYLDALQDELKDNVSGLVLYDTASVDAIPETLCSLPRLSLSGTDSPHQLLNAVTLGVDIFTIPFIAEATDAGIALDFSFPAHNGVGSKERLALGVDMWSSRFATDVAPLRADCQCYTCTTHHRAFLQHLLNAKEMLGWVLLQIHNHHIMHEFFVGVRRSIQVGSFEAERTAFERTYAVELPAKTGQGPRTRGYQFKSEGKGEARKNPKAFRLLGDGKEKLAEAALPSPTADAEDLEQQGFAQMAE